MILFSSSLIFIKKNVFSLNGGKLASMINRQNTKQKHKGHLTKHEHVNKEVENQKS